MKRSVYNGALFLGLGAVVWYFVFRQVPLGELRTAVLGANPAALLAAVGCMALYFLCDAANTAQGLGRLGYRPGLRQCLHYSAVGFFFSAVTPSATGGQPMQIFYMRKNGVDPAHGALVLLLELACWQTVAVVFGALGLWAGGEIFGQLSGPIRTLVAVGVGMNLLTLGGVLAAIFFPGGVCRMGGRVAQKLLRHPRASKIWGAVQTQLERFAESAPLIRRSPGLLVRMALTTAAQLAALYSIPFWVHRALGLTGWSLPEMASVQAVVSLAVSSLPLPGAMGAGEGGFLTAFGLLFPARLLGSAMVLSRGISFYLIVLLTGVALMIARVHAARAQRPRPTGLL